MFRWLRSRTFAAVLSGLVLALLLFLDEHHRAQGGKFLHSDWMLFLLWLVAPLVLLRAWLRERADGPAHERPPLPLPALALFGGMTLYLFSGACKHPWFYFLDWHPGGTAATACTAAGLVRWVLLTSLFMLFLLPSRKRTWPALLVILVAAQAAGLWMLLQTTHGLPIYKDDHPSFMFRLWEFSRTFPRLVTYNPYWNGGVVNFVGTTSGTPALGLPLYPLWRLFPVHEVYTLGIGLMYVVVMPWLAVMSLRIMGAGRTAALCAGILALGVSRHFFLWMLHYGTIGAAFASFCVLPVSACVYRVVCLRKTEKWLFIVLVLSAFFLMQWQPCALLAVPLLLSAVLARRRWRARTWGFLLLSGIAALLLNLRALLTVLLQGESLMQFVLDGPDGAAAQAPPAADVLWRGATHLLSHVQEGHPVLIFLGLAGIFFLPQRSVRRWCWPILLFFAVLGGWGRDIKPNLQLSRMAIPMFFAAVIPAALLAARILRCRRPGLAPVRAALLALLLLGGWNVAQLYASRGHAPYTVQPPFVKELTDWIGEHAPEDARVLFAGKCVHYYGRGHVAYLPRYAGREMMACDYYAFPPKTVEYNYPPGPFRKPEERLFEFMELYNVSHVITYHDNWKMAFIRHPGQFQPVYMFPDGRTVIFRVRRDSSLFLRGNGEVKADFNRIEVRLSDPDEEAVLKYNWSDALRAPAPVELFAWPAGDGIELIGVRPNGRSDFTVRFRHWL